MITIRRVGRDDLVEVSAGLAASWRATYHDLLGPEEVTRITREWHAPAVLAEQIDRPGTAFLLAEQAGSLVGSAFAAIDEAGQVCLRRLYMRPGHEGRGIGRLLLDETLARLSERDVWLEVEPRNEGAIRFYERAGFVRGSVAAGCNRRADLAALVLRRPARPVARRAMDSDAQDLFGLITLAFAEYPGCYVDPHADFPDLLAPSSRVAAAGGMIWVVEDSSGRICACIGLRGPDDEGTAELKTIYVRPDRRRRGLAASLVALVEENARRGGAKQMVLWSDTRFTDAHRLYGRLGYVRFPGTRTLDDISSSVEYGFARAL